MSWKDINFNVISSRPLSDGTECLNIPPSALHELVKHLAAAPEFDFDILTFICGSDLNDRFEILYSLYATQRAEKIVLKVALDKNNPSVDSICDIFPSANWDEREIYDLLGIQFKNHPNLERLLLPKDWIGYPLRKDYEMTDERLKWNS